MKAEARDTMVKLVQDTFAKYPTVESLPVATKGDVLIELNGEPPTQNDYVNALYALCAKCTVVEGRTEDGLSLIGSA